MPSIDEVVGLLKLSLCSDTILIKQSTHELKMNCFNNKDCLSTLVSIITNPVQQLEIQQIASIELRKKISIYWSQISIELRAEMKTALLISTASNASIIVRHAIARVVTEIANLDLQSNSWPEFLPFVFELIASQNALQRESATFILYNCFDAVIDYAMDQMTQILVLMKVALIDDAFPVCINAMQILGRVSELIEPTDSSLIEMYSSILPLMVNVLIQSTRFNDTLHASTAFQETPLISNNLDELTRLYLGLALDLEQNSDIRIMSLNSISWITTYHKSRLLKLNILPFLISSLFHIINVSDFEDDEELDETPSKAALHLISQVSISLPSKSVFPIIVQLIENAKKDSELIASMLCLGVMVDGCASYMSERIVDIIGFIVKCLGHTNNSVFESGCKSLTAIIDELNEDIVPFHQFILPAIVPKMSHSRHAVNTISTLLESCVSQEYVHEIMQQLGGMLSHSTQESKMKEFEVYFKECMVILVQLISSNDHQLVSVCIDTIGTIADSVGAHLFSPYFSACMNMVIEAQSSNDGNIAECALICLTQLAHVFKSDFVGYLPTVIPLIMIKLNTEEDDPNVSLESEEKETGSSTSITQEKQAGAQCLGQLFSAVGTGFLGYLEETQVILLDLCDHYHEQVRCAAACALLEYISTYYSLSVAESASHNISFHEQVKCLVNISMPCIVSLLSEEFDKNTFLSVMQDLRCLIELSGRQVIEDQFEELIELTSSVLKKSHSCQLDEEEEIELAEYDLLVIGSAMDLVVTLAKVMNTGESICLMRKCMPLILKYFDTETSICCGTLAECIDGMKADITEFSIQLLETFGKGLQLDDEETKSNCAYGMGVLCEYSCIDLSSKCMDILKLLYPLFRQESDVKNMTDNACGAVSRMILKYHSALPLVDVFSVLIGYLPLRMDQQEYDVCLKAILMGLEMRVVDVSRLGVLATVDESTLSESSKEMMKRIKMNIHL